MLRAPEDSPRGQNTRVASATDTVFGISFIEPYSFEHTCHSFFEKSKKWELIGLAFLLEGEKDVDTENSHLVNPRWALGLFVGSLRRIRWTGSSFRISLSLLVCCFADQFVYEWPATKCN